MDAEVDEVRDADPRSLLVETLMVDAEAEPADELGAAMMDN